MKVGVLKEWELGEVVGKGTMQQCSIFCNLKRAKGRKPRKKRWKLGLQGRGDGMCGPPCPPSPQPAQVPCNGLISNPGGSGITIILHFRLE